MVLSRPRILDSAPSRVTAAGFLRTNRQDQSSVTTYAKCRPRPKCYEDYCPKRLLGDLVIVGRINGLRFRVVPLRVLLGDPGYTLRVKRTPNHRSEWECHFACSQSDVLIRRQLPPGASKAADSVKVLRRSQSTTRNCYITAIMDSLRDLFCLSVLFFMVPKKLD